MTIDEVCPNFGLVEDFFDKMLIKFGHFKLANGTFSPVYVDLGPLPSYPWLLKKTAAVLGIKLREEQFLGQMIAGLPMRGLPIAIAVGMGINRPVIYPRQAKDHGTRRTVEGAGYRTGDQVIVVDDVATDGITKMTYVDILNEAGLQVRDVLVVIDREQGASKRLAEAMVRLHSLFTLSQAIEGLRMNANLADEEYDKARQYLEQFK